MAEIDEKQLEAILCRVLNSRKKIDDELHDKHHKFIDLLIEREERRREGWRKFKLSFIGGIALATVSGLIWLGALVIEFLRGGPPPGPTN